MQRDMPTDTYQPSFHVSGSTRKASTIGEELMITGDVTSKGEIHLDSQVQGDIHCILLFLGENARLEGKVIAEEVVIGGRLIGSVRARLARLQAKSHVDGDLFHQSLAIDGAYFEGKSCRSEELLSRQGALGDQPLTKPQLVSEQRGDKPSTAPIQSFLEAG
jgi:cytoskeletal protein CcmA (bactofilin family)